MDINEKKKLIEHTIDIVDGRTKVIAGTGGNNTKEVIECQNSLVMFGQMVF